MAQGANKLKSKGFSLRKEKNRQKKQQMKKGGRYIAPKKAKVLEQAKLKQGLDKAIKANIEQEITQKVKSVEAKAFNIISGPSTSGTKPGTKPGTKSKQSSDAVKSKHK